MVHFNAETGIFTAFCRHGVHCFAWRFDSHGLIDALRMVGEAAARGDISWDQAARMTLSMRHAVAEAIINAGGPI
jgi:hypothetical protein